MRTFPPASAGERADADVDVLEARFFPPSGGPDAAPFSRSGTVRPLVDGVEFFSAVRAEIDRLAPGDCWYVAGWLFRAGFRFGAGGPPLESLLAARAAAGVDVRVILWASRVLLETRPPGGSVLGAYRQVCVANAVAAERLRSLTVPSGAAPLAGRVLLDWSGNAASSHHMKLNLIVRGDAVTAFAGGLDYWPDRYDAAPHTSMPVTRPDGTSVPWGWHDAGVAVTGVPARRVLDTFRTRWTEAATLSPATYDSGAGQRPFNPPPLPPLPATPPARPPTPDPHTSIQVIRSWPDSKEFRPLGRNVPWSTLPATGVHEILRTLQTAIGAARRYVYVEDQAFDAEDTLFPGLAAACRRGVKVIAVLPGWVDPNDGTNTPVNQRLGAAVQRGLVDRLSPAQSGNLAVWRLDNVTVHAKVILIDDQFLCIGSANAMDRSLQYTLGGDDSELSVAAVSTGSLVADLRVRLWAEHLRLATSAALVEVRDLDRSLGVWRPSWGSGLTVPRPSGPLAFVGPPAPPG